MPSVRECCELTLASGFTHYWQGLPVLGGGSSVQMFEEWDLLVNKSTVVLARSSAVDCTTFEPHTSLFPLVFKAGYYSPIRSHVQLCVNQVSRSALTLIHLPRHWGSRLQSYQVHSHQHGRKFSRAVHIVQNTDTASDSTRLI